MRKTQPYWLAVGLLCLIAIFATYPLSRAVADVVFLAAALVGVYMAPRHLGVLSWSAGIPIFYLLFFLALPMLGDATSQTASGNTVAVYLASGGLLAFLVGVLVARFSKPPAEPLMLLTWDGSRKPYLIFVLTLVGGLSAAWSYTFGYFGLVAERDVGASAGIISSATFFLTIANVMAWNAYFKTGKLLPSCFVSTALMVLIGAFSNSKAQMILPFLYIGLSMWGVGGKFPTKLFFGAIVLYVFVAFPYVTISRIAAQGGEYFGDKTAIARAAVDYLISTQWLEGTTSLNPFSTVDRGLLSYFSSIIDQAGNSVQFLHGETILQGLGTMVPRFVYEGKSEMNITNWTAQLFGEISVYDDVTNVAPTYMGEFYMNFGVAGVFVGMFLVGILAVFVDRYAIVSRRSWTMPIMMSFIVWQESVVGHTIIPFLKGLVLWVPVLILVERSLRRVNFFPGAIARGSARV